MAREYIHIIPHGKLMGINLLTILILVLVSLPSHAFTTHSNSEQDKQQSNQAQNDNAPGDDVRPSGKGVGDPSTERLQRAPNNRLNAVVKKPGLQNGIYYHGGPVLSATISQGKTVYITPKVYLIYYGDWSYNPGTIPIINNLVGGSNGMNGLGGSPYFNINTTYTNSNGSAIQNGLILAGTITDNYSQGVNLTDLGVQNVISKAVNTNVLPYDPNAIYLVLTSKDVAETSGFCTAYCAWHSYMLYNSKPLIYGFIGDTGRCPSACAAQTTVSPNNNPSADGMVDSIAHEIEEAITDPLLNAWYDHRGYENADKCAWNYGTTKSLPNGSVYNMTINGLNYLIQQNWVNANRGYCGLTY